MYWIVFDDIDGFRFISDPVCFDIKHIFNAVSKTMILMLPSLNKHARLIRQVSYVSYISISLFLLFILNYLLTSRQKLFVE